MSVTETAASAETLAARGDVRAAVAILERLAAAEDGDALFLLASWTLRGTPLRRDLPLSRGLFGRAAQAGRGDAARIVTALVAQGIGGPRDWPRALEMLAVLARSDPRAAEQQALIAAMALDGAGDPAERPAGQVLSTMPEVSRFPALLSGEECAHLIKAAEPMMAPAVVVDPRSGAQRPDPVRRADSAGFTWPLENPAVHAINRRIAAASGTATANGEPLEILRYRPGQEYRPHLDAIPGAANQRVWTMLIRLNDGYEGGATVFPSVGLEIEGGAGDAILFRNLGADGRPIPASLHAGAPVRAGTKYLATRWICQRPFEQ